jgi:cobalamin biosynthesis protein CbiD
MELAMNQHSHQHETTQYQNTLIKLPENINPPVLSYEQWQKAQRQLGKRRNNSYTNYSINYLKKQIVTINNHQAEMVLLNGIEGKLIKIQQIICRFNIDFLTAKVRLILVENQAEQRVELTLNELSVTQHTIELMHNLSVDIFESVNTQIPSFALRPNQQLILRVSGGVTLVDNILLVSTK